MSLLQRISHFIRNVYTSFYWDLFWPGYKFLYRRFTGLHELERKALAQDVPGFYMSIKNSKQLPQIKQYFEEEIYTQDVLDVGIINEIYTKKQIPRTKKNFDLFLKMFNKIFNVIKSKQYLDEVRKVSFQHKDQKHKERLLHFWNLLRNNEPLPSMITRKWIDVGFQGEDPATDFRGAGFLGLENLIYFTETYPQYALKTYKESCDPKHHYFFAAAGLYLTLEIYFMMNNNYFDDLFYQASTKEKAMAVFGEIYSAMFHMFDRFWLQQENATMMTFNGIILEYFGLIKGDLLPELRRTTEEACRLKKLI